MKKAFLPILCIVSCFFEACKNEVKITVSTEKESTTDNENEDLNPPRVDEGSLSIALIGASSVILTWTKAVDDVSPQDQLSYKVFYTKIEKVSKLQLKTEAIGADRD